MKKPLLPFLLFILLLFSQMVIAQDVIVKENGEEIKSKVVEVSKNEIKYKNFEDPEFATCTIAVKEVKMIRFEDGTEKTFKAKKMPHFITLSFSEVIPVGDYASTSTNPQENTYYNAGYAKNGQGAMLDAGFYFFRNLGVSVVAGGFENKINDREFSKSYTQSMDSLTNINYRFGKWHASYFLFGPIYSFKIGGKFGLDIRIMIGKLTLEKPEFQYHYNRGFDYHYSSHNGKATSFAISGNVNFRYHFSKKWGARFGIDVLPTDKVNIEYTDEIDEQYGTGFRKRIENNRIHQKADVIKFNLGLMFLFNR